MQFTLTFLRLFFLGIYLAAPLLFFLASVIIVIGQIVGRRESWSRYDAAYWSLITATTVGYGDLRPSKKLSKALSAMVALTGLILTGILVAIALNAASTAFKEHADLDRVKMRIEQRGE